MYPDSNYIIIYIYQFLSGTELCLGATRAGGCVKKLSIPLRVFIIVSVLSLSFGCSKKSNAETEKATGRLSSAGFFLFDEKIEAPDFTLNDLMTGEEVTLSSLKGKVVFLNFWGEWCPYCRAEMPAMQELHEKLEGKDFAILGVNYGDEENVAEAYMKDNNFTFQSVRDITGTVVQGYGIEGFPTTMLIGKDGNLIGAKVGPIPEKVDDLVTALITLSE